MRLCNPGNLRHSNSRWKGLADEQTDKSFCRFTSPEMGYRALWIVLRNYWHRHGLCMPSRILRRYAPPSENETGHYIQHMWDLTGIAPDQVLPPPEECESLWEKFIMGITCIEQGMRMGEVDVHAIREGYRLAFGTDG